MLEKESYTIPFLTQLLLPDSILSLSPFEHNVDSCTQLTRISSSYKPTTQIFFSPTHFFKPYIIPPVFSSIITPPSTLLPQSHLHNSLQMMHRCSTSHVGPCSCGLFHAQSSSFSVVFSMPNHLCNTGNCDMYSSVDCTLSLGTPSTRLTQDVEESRRVRHDCRHSSSSSCMSNFCWDMFQNKNTSSYPTSSHISKSNKSRGSNSGDHNSLSSNDPLLARRCANCDTTSTPLWRNGPRGPKSLCNACGIRFKKEERRANANGGNGSQSGSSGTDYGYQSNSTWVQSQKMACFSAAANEYRFIEDNDVDSDSGIPFLSWRLNRQGV